MSDPAGRLFDDFAASWARGEMPDAREYLEQAGEGAEELAGLIDAYLVAAPAPEPDEQTVSVMAAWMAGDSPLVEMRRAGGLSRASVVDALAVALGIAAAKKPKLGLYYHRLEAGLLDLGAINDRVFDALADALGTTRSRLAAFGPAPDAAEGLVFHRAPGSEEPPSDARTALYARLEMLSPAPSDPPDEVDRLFGVGG